MKQRSFPSHSAVSKKSGRSLGSSGNKPLASDERTDISKGGNRLPSRSTGKSRLPGGSFLSKESVLLNRVNVLSSTVYFPKLGYFLVQENTAYQENIKFRRYLSRPGASPAKLLRLARALGTGGPMARALEVLTG